MIVPTEASCEIFSLLTLSAQLPSITGIGLRLPLLETGTHNVIAAPEGIMTVSVVTTGGEGDCVGIAIDGGRDGGADAGAV